MGETELPKSAYDRTRRLVALSPFLNGEPKAVLKREAMETLITSEWVEQEAAARELSVSESDVDRLFERQREEGFPSAAAYERFLEESGMSDDDLRDLIRLQELQRRVQQLVGETTGSVSEGAIADFYEQHRDEFRHPERRDLLLVLTKTRAEAETAKRELESGGPWRTVIRRHSIDPENARATAVRGPRLAEGREALERLVYRTPENVVAGPVKTDPGWYVFEVVQIRPPAKRSLEEAQPEIEAELRKPRVAEALERWRERFRKRTVCADDYRVKECSNGPPLAGGE